MTGPDPARNTETAAAMPPAEQQDAEHVAAVQRFVDRTDVPARRKITAADRFDALQERPQLVAVIVAGAAVLTAVLASKALRRQR